ncbi:10713_t:CDS:2 [Funneliformis geosporum]|nr:10713_t:CDS:2 [Funneliformis geosporum]
MLGNIKRSVFKTGYTIIRHYQNKNYIQYEKNKYDGYWNLILKQPKSSNDLHHNNDIVSLAIKPTTIQEVKSLYTIDGEKIPQKPEFPNNCLDVLIEDNNNNIDPGIKAFLELEKSLNNKF